jgi:multidrug efflux pump subunit AcrA (membrane-fusion protein)
MSRKILASLLLAKALWALDVPIDEVKKQVFKETITVNSKIVQLSSAKESVMARVGGRVTKYLVQQGQSVKRGQAIATIESLELAKLSSELKLLRKQLSIHNKNYKILKSLFDKGLESMEKVNKEQRERDETASKIEGIKNQLKLLGVGSSGAVKSSYTVYAQGSGTVAKILLPTNSVVNANTPLVSIVKGGSSFLVQSYVPMNYVSDVKVGQEGKLLYGGKNYKMHISQILPELDEQTQQMVVLSSLDESVTNLFVNAYVDSKLSIGEPKSYLAVKKSALSFFNNEWVVFVPEHHEEEGHDEHEHHDAHNDDETRRGHAPVLTRVHDEKEHDDHDEHEGHGHDDHEEEEVPYDIKVVKILKQNENWVAIEGLAEHEDYVSDKSYYIKSLLLKSSLGGHGH